LELSRLAVGALGRLVEFLGLYRLHPNWYTVAGLLLALLAPLSAYLGYWGPTLALMAISAFMDALDGVVARVSGRQSRFGAFLDSMSDRVSDASYILALTLMGASGLLCYTLLVASYLVSYARARGEGLGVQLKGVGLVERQERVLAILLAGALLAVDATATNILLGLLLALSLVTVAQRVYAVYKQTSSSY